MFILTFLSSKTGKQISVCFKSLDGIFKFSQEEVIKNFNVTYVPTSLELDD